MGIAQIATRLWGNQRRRSPLLSVPGGEYSQGSVTGSMVFTFPQHTVPALLESQQIGQSVVACLIPEFSHFHVFHLRLFTGMRSACVCQHSRKYKQHPSLFPSHISSLVHRNPKCETIQNPGFRDLSVVIPIRFMFSTFSLRIFSSTSGNHRQHDVRRVPRIVVHTLLRLEHRRPCPGILSRIQVPVKAWKVAARYLYPDPMPR